MSLPCFLPVFCKSPVFPRTFGLVAVYPVEIMSLIHLIKSAFISSICRLVYTIQIAPSRGVLYTFAQTALWGYATTHPLLLSTAMLMRSLNDE